MFALQFPASLLTLAFALQAMAGASLSITVTVCVQVVALPDESSAVHVNMVMPTGKLAATVGRGAGLLSDTGTGVNGGITIPG
jgi:hypothetical protein